MASSSSNDQTFFNMANNSNFDFGTAPMTMDPSYDIGSQQLGHAMSTDWALHNSFYGYPQAVSRQEYLDLLQRFMTLKEEVAGLTESLKNLKAHNRAVAPFLNELRDLVKYIVRRDDPHVTIRTPQQEDFEEVEIVVDNTNQEGKGWTAPNQTG